MTRNLLVALVLLIAAGCADRGEPTVTFTELVYPGSSSTVAGGINDAGHIVGWYVQDSRTSGFLYKDGEFTSVQHPQAALTQVTGLGPDGSMVGWYRRPGEPSAGSHAFLRTPAGEFLELDHPDHKHSMALGILPNGTVVGCFHADDAVNMWGFTIPRHAITANGVVPDAIQITDAAGSMHGGATPDETKIVGKRAREAYVIEEGVLRTFGVPGATLTEAWDISPSGVIVGAFVDEATVSHGFILEGERFTTLDYPGAKSTVLFGINARGQIVGAYEGIDGQRRGFVATRR